MLRRLDRIRFRGHRRDDFLDLAESPNASDTECGDEGPLRAPRTSPRDSEELRDPVSAPCGVPSTWPQAPGLSACGSSSPGSRAEPGLGQTTSCPAGRGQAWLAPAVTCHHVTVGLVPRSRIRRPPCHQGPVRPLGFSFRGGVLGGWLVRLATPGCVPLTPGRGGPSPAHAETVSDPRRPVGGVLLMGAADSRGISSLLCGRGGSQAPGGPAFWKLLSHHGIGVGTAPCGPLSGRM